MVSLEMRFLRMFWLIVCSVSHLLSQQELCYVVAISNVALKLVNKGVLCVCCMLVWTFLASLTKGALKHGFQPICELKSA